MTALQIEAVSKQFGTSAGPAALHNVSLAVKPGEMVVLLGPSGSGKTTLLRCVAGLTEPTDGSIQIGERVVVDCERHIHVPTHKRGLGMVFQSFALWPHMTVRENVAYPLDRRHAARNQRVDEMLALVRCSHLADRLPSTLSGGQQQRIALVRALASAPALLLFDEPLSNLDALLRIELRAQLRQIHRMTGFTGLYVTHDQVEAMSLGSRVAVMNQGRLEQIGAPEEIYFAPATDFVAEFMGMGNQLVVDRDGTRADGSGQRVIGFSSENAAGGAAKTILRFRPESLMMEPGPVDAPGDRHFVIPDLEIVDRAFSGEYVEYSLQSASVMLKARAGRGIEPRGVGEKVNGLVPRAEAAVFDHATTG